jgi:molecular chaperone GrpE (heat shock protein)
MTQPAFPRQTKWPFFLADAVLLALAVAIIFLSAQPLGFWPLAFVFLSVSAACLFGIAPFLHDHRAALAMSQSESLASGLGQLKNLDQIKNQIAGATSHWEQAVEHSKQTVKSAAELSAQMKVETEEFCRFLEKSNEVEKQHLRLEVEKLRRAEGEWLQVMVRIFDHIYALYGAACRSGQEKLIGEIGGFQQACRDIARRLGLTPLLAEPGTPFNPEHHQLADPDESPPEQACVRETLATGFSFQGQLLRKPVVRVEPPHQDPAPDSNPDPNEHSAPPPEKTQPELSW